MDALPDLTDVADIARKALTALARPPILSLIRVSVETRKATLSTCRAAAIRLLAAPAAENADARMEREALALCVCGIDDAISSLASSEAGEQDAFAQSARKKLDSARYTAEATKSDADLTKRWRQAMTGCKDFKQHWRGLVGS